MKKTSILMVLCLLCCSWLLHAQSTWTTTTIYANSTANEQMGRAIDMSANGRVAVGGALVNGQNGRVFVMANSGSGWGSEGFALEGSSSSRFGESVSISDDGEWLAVGAPYADGTGGPYYSQVGLVYIYQRQVNGYGNASWQLASTIQYPTSNVSGFGRKVALSGDGNIVAINYQTATGSRVVLYQKSGSSWVLRGGEISISQSAPFSLRLSHNGGTLAIGVPGIYNGTDPLTSVSDGQALIYEWSDADNTWMPKGNPLKGTADSGENLGYDLALTPSGDTLVVSAPFYNDPDTGTQVGRVQSYVWDGSNWNPYGNEVAERASSVDIAANGKTIALGIPFYGNSYGGAVVVYRMRGDTSWVQKGDRVEGQNYDYMGYQVAISPDGSEFIANHNAWSNYSWRGKVTIHTEPIHAFTFNVTSDGSPLQGATVEINGQTLTTNSNGQVSIVLPEDDYAYTLSKAGYETATGVISPTQTNTSISIDIQLAYTLTFEVTAGGQALAGASVTIDGQTLTTDANGQATIDLASDTYNYTVSAEHYLDKSGSVTINGTTLTEQVSLDPKPYTLTFEVTAGGQALAGASVTIDGQTLTTDANGQATIDLVSDTYNYTVSAQYYLDKTGSVSINNAPLTEQVSLAQDPLSVEELAQYGMQLYPNPTVGEVVFSSKNSCRLVLFDISGQLIKEMHTQGGKATISFTGLDAGIYILSITDEQKNKHFTHRIVKQ